MLLCTYAYNGWWVLQEVAFFDVTRTGELLSRLSEDTQIIKNAATTNLSEALRNLSTAFIGLGFMFATSWKLTRKNLSSIMQLINFTEESRSSFSTLSFISSIGFGYCSCYLCGCAQIWSFSSRTFSQDSSCSRNSCFNCWGLSYHYKFWFSCVSFEMHAHYYKAPWS